jgi:hypothetical protein
MKRPIDETVPNFWHWLPSAVFFAAAAFVAFTALLSVAWAVTAVGFLVSSLLSLAVVNHLRGTRLPSEPSLREVPFAIAGDPEVFHRYQQLVDSLLKISRQTDAIFRYRSVAWVKNANYWQDEPTRKSMAVNFELHECERLNIERIAIIADELWPDGDVWPAAFLRQWLHEQHVRGIWVKFVRQSALAVAFAGLASMQRQPGDWGRIAAVRLGIAGQLQQLDLRGELSVGGERFRYHRGGVFNTPHHLALCIQGIRASNLM